MIYYKDETITIRSMKPEDIDLILEGFGKQGWSKSRSTLEMYLSKQEAGALHVFIAEQNTAIAGYTTLIPCVTTGPFANRGLPEISDFNVFMPYQRKGIGNKILDAAEAVACRINDTITLGVGLHSGYGAAQRIYVKRGYVPDGSGVWYQDKPLAQYADCRNDDELVLYLSRALR